MFLRRFSSLLAVFGVFCTASALALQKERQCLVTVPYINSSDHTCDVVSQGSISFTCTYNQPNLTWSGKSLWNGELKVTVGNETKLPDLKIKGVTLKEKSSNKTCFSSTLIFSGTLQSLAQLNDKVLFCSNIPTRFEHKLSDNIIFVLPVVLGAPTLTKVSSSLECDSDGMNNQTIQWTPPDIDGELLVIEHYEVTGIPQSAICSPGPCDMINATNTTTTISGLGCDTDYMISVRAVSVCGINGTFSDPVRVIFHPRATSTSVTTSTTKHTSSPSHTKTPTHTSTPGHTATSTHVSSTPSSHTATTSSTHSTDTTNAPSSTASIQPSVTETITITSCNPTDVHPSFTEIIRYQSCTPAVPLEQNSMLGVEVGIPITFILTAIISSLLTLLVTFLILKRKALNSTSDYDPL